MDFFNAQRQAHRSTGLLVCLFAAAVACLIFGLWALVSFSLGLYDPAENSMWNARTLAVTALSTLAVVGSGTAYKLHQLRGGGAAVCRLLGAHPVPLTTLDQPLRRLRNLAEEMAIASGVPVPQLFILDEERGINAFAAGYAIGDAAICVTRGCLDRLDRDELQGIIAHEFSHILNGDMRLNIRLMGVLHGIVCISMAGYLLLRTGHLGNYKRGKGGLGIAGLGLGCIVIGSIGALFARLIKAAVSRQREFLADASAVQFTRNPAGISGALKKIAGLPGAGRLQTPHAHAASHMFFANALRRGWGNWFATHPPITARIAAIDPLFAKYAGAVAPRQPRQRPGSTGLPATVAAFGAGNTSLAAEQTTATIGNVTPDHIAFSQQFVADLPPVIAGALHEPFGARAVVFSMLLNQDGEVRRRQFQELQRTADPATVQETLELSNAIRDLPRLQRLPVVDLAMPALRSMSLDQAKAFRRQVKTLIDADAKVTLFEYALEKVLNRHLDSAFLAPRLQAIRFKTVEAVRDNCGLVLSVLAHAGHEGDPAATEKAFLAGALQLGGGGKLVPREVCDRGRMEQSLDRLVVASPEVKKTALHAFAHCVANDGEMTAIEAELLRAIADSIECPMPPIPLPAQSGVPTMV